MNLLEIFQKNCYMGVNNLTSSWHSAQRRYQYVHCTVLRYRYCFKLFLIKNPVMLPIRTVKLTLKITVTGRCEHWYTHLNFMQHAENPHWKLCMLTLSCAFASSGILKMNHKFLIDWFPAGMSKKTPIPVTPGHLFCIKIEYQICIRRQYFSGTRTFGSVADLWDYYKSSCRFYFQQIQSQI